MSLEVRIQQKPGYLHFTVTGENSSQNVKATLERVRAECVKRKCSSALLEENLRGPSLPIVDMYEIIATASEAARSIFSRLAYVDVNPSHDRQRLKFAETVAVNRAVSVRLFPSVDLAAQWLEEALNTTRSASSDRDLANDPSSRQSRPSRSERGPYRGRTVLPRSATRKRTR